MCAANAHMSVVVRYVLACVSYLVARVCARVVGSGAATRRASDADEGCERGRSTCVVRVTVCELSSMRDHQLLRWCTQCEVRDEC